MGALEQSVHRMKEGIKQKLLIGYSLLMPLHVYAVILNFEMLEQEFHLTDLM